MRNKQPEACSSNIKRNSLERLTLSIYIIDRLCDTIFCSCHSPFRHFFKNINYSKSLYHLNTVPDYKIIIIILRIFTKNLTIKFSEYIVSEILIYSSCQVKTAPNSHS